MSLPPPSFPQQPPGASFGTGAMPPWPGQPGVLTLQRQVSEGELSTIALASRRHVLYPVLGWATLAGAVLLALLGALIGGGVAAWVMPLTFVVLVGVSAAIGLPLGAAVAKSITRQQLGPARVLTVAWNEFGFSYVSWTRSLTVQHREVRRIHDRGGVWLIRFRVRSLVDPYLIALPKDLVPQAAMEQWRALGVKGLPA